jgi:hypothetical protein
MKLVWLPVKRLLGAITLAGVSTLGYGLGICSACSYARRGRARRPQADPHPTTPNADSVI